MKKSLYIPLLSVLTVMSPGGATAQNYTYIHEIDVWSAFRFAESSAGSPHEMTMLAHPGYEPKYRWQNKLGCRFLFTPVLTADVANSEAIDSAMTDRGKMEALTYLDHLPTTDLSYIAVQHKIDKIQDIFHGNVERILVLGGTRAVYDQWHMTEEMLGKSVSVIHEAYMPSGAKTEQYQAIYSDIAKQNKDLMAYLARLESQKLLRGYKESGGEVPRPNIRDIATHCYVNLKSSWNRIHAVKHPIARRRTNSLETE